MTKPTDSDQRTVLSREEQLARPIEGAVEGVAFSIHRGETQIIQTPRGRVELSATDTGIRATMLDAPAKDDGGPDRRVVEAMNELMLAMNVPRDGNWYNVSFYVQRREDDTQRFMGASVVTTPEPDAAGSSLIAGRVGEQRTGKDARACHCEHSRAMHRQSSGLIGACRACACTQFRPAFGASS